MATRQFFGTYENKLDSKNRMSIPASFRAVIRDIESQKLILKASLKFPAIEAYPDVYFAEFESTLRAREAFSDDRYNLAWDIYSDATEVEPDRDGRIVLTPDLIATAGLSGEVSVVGLGDRFEIWDRTAARARAAERRALAMAASAPRPMAAAGQSMAGPA